MHKSKMKQIVALSGLMLAAGTANSADFGLYATAGTIGLGGGVAAWMLKCPCPIGVGEGDDGVVAGSADGGSAKCGR